MIDVETLAGFAVLLAFGFVVLASLRSRAAVEERRRTEDILRHARVSEARRRMIKAHLD